MDTVIACWMCGKDECVLINRGKTRYECTACKDMLSSREFEDSLEEYEERKRLRLIKEQEY